MKRTPSPSEFIRRPASMMLGCMMLALSYTVSERADAIMIQADLTNLTDLVPGQDSWRAAYTISGHTFSANQGFTIYFDSLLYSGLSTPVSPVPAGWDVLSIQPDPLLSAPGFLDGLALVNSASLASSFVIDFLWLGGATPGVQAFELYDLTGNFQILETGQTTIGTINGGGGGGTNTVPDGGSTVWLLGLASVGLLAGKKRFSRKQAK